MNKKEIRSDIKKILKEYSPDFENESKRINDSIIKSQAFQDAQVILAYMALPDEVNLSFVIEEALKTSKKIFLPHVFPGTNKMEFFPFYKTSQTVTGDFGIMEPEIKEEDNGFLKNVENLESDIRILVLTPGRAFDKAGGRIGRGKGFYDIYFNKLSDFKNKINFIKAGVCFPPQVIENIPMDSNDIPMDMLFY